MTVATGDGHDDPAGWPSSAGSSVRSRWTLALAVLVSVMILGGAALAWQHDRSESTDPPGVALPGPWLPPTVPASDTSVPVLDDPSSSVPAAAGTASPAQEATAPPRTRPPAPDPEAPPVTPTLSVTQASVPATVDLAAGGARDWVHWGLTSASSIDRKSGGTGEIKDLGGPGGRGRYDNNPQRFTWTGGTPTGSTGPTPTGVYTCKQGNGFIISAAAAPTTRTLRFYAGVWMARGQLTLSLAGRTATASLENPRAIRTTQFVIRFRAPAGQSLRVTWTTAVSHHPDCGNVDMQAATLS
jgi:hypothetical protein